MAIMNEDNQDASSNMGMTEMEALNMVSKELARNLDSEEDGAARFQRVLATPERRTCLCLTRMTLDVGKCVSGARSVARSLVYR